MGRRKFSRRGGKREIKVGKKGRRGEKVWDEKKEKKAGEGE